MTRVDAPNASYSGFLFSKGESVRIFKTAKGTDLPISDIKGKDYLQVAWRIVWFREEHPNWSIVTELVSYSQDGALAKAQIIDDKGQIIATAHKTETKQGFGDFIEKAETGAIGRALAHCGFGTQFAAELDENERLADSPVSHPKKTQTTQFNTVPSGNTPSYDARRDAKMAGPMTEKQRNMMKHLGDEVGMNAAERMDFLEGRGIDPKNITKQQASDCIEELQMLAKPIKNSVNDFADPDAKSFSKSEARTNA